MQDLRKFEATLATELLLRGLRRAPGGLAFIHDGQPVRVSVGESLYRGLVVTVDAPPAARQFRAARDGAHDWDAIAAAIVDAVRRRKGEDQREAAPNQRDAGLSIRPSPTTPGRVRVRLSEMELDAYSAMQLYAVLQHALPTLRRGTDAQLLPS
jgi:hypothetical protein